MFRSTLLVVAMCVSVVLMLNGCALPKATESTSDNEQERQASYYARDGLNFYSRGRYFEAEKNFRLAIKYSTRNPSLEYNLAVALEKQGSLFEASSILESLTTRYNKEPLFWAARARISGSKGNIFEAIELNTTAIEAANKNKAEQVSNTNYVGENFDVRGLLIAQSGLTASVGRIEDAICYSEEAYLQSPSPADLDRHIRTLLNFGRLRQAFERATRAIKTKEVGSTSTELIRAIVFYFVQMKRCEDALGWLERAARSGIPEGSVALDFDLALLSCNKAPRFLQEEGFSEEETKTKIASLLEERKTTKSAFGLGLPPVMIVEALAIN